MTRKEIFDRYEQGIRHIKESKGADSFIKIVDDMDFIMNKGPVEFEQLSDEETILYGMDLFKKEIEFYLELVKKFMQDQYGITFRINENEQAPAQGSACYNAENNETKLSPLGMLIGGRSKTSVLQSLFHEARHQVQHASYKTSTDDLLKYPSNAILLLKESLLFGQGTEEHKKRYLENYPTLYYEEDANEFSYWGVRNILSIMYTQYYEYAKKNHIEIPADLSEKIYRLQVEMMGDSLEREKERNQKMGRIPQIEREAKGETPPTTTCVLNGQTVDKLIAMDKYVKSHPELQQDYPILRLLFDGDKPKTYEQITDDMMNLLGKYNGEETIPNAIPEATTYNARINSIYDVIIRTDPILFIQELICMRNEDGLQSFLAEHPTLVTEYYEELQEIANKTGNARIIQLLEQNKK